MGSLRAMLAPKPFRGDLIAAGAGALSVGLVLLDTRVQDDWATGVRFVVLALGAALLLGMAWLAPVEGATPRMYVSALLVAAFPVLAFALVELSLLLGADGGAGAVTWIALLVGAKYGFFAWRRGSPISTLLAAAAGVVALLAAWSWIFDPHSPTPLQWLCLVAIVVLALAAIALRDHHRPHAVALIDVAGLTALLLAYLLAAEAVIVGWTSYAGATETGPVTFAGAGWGWKLVLVAVGFGLVAYGAVDGERGPVWLGVGVLTAFVLLAGPGNLLWWPLILVLIGAVAIAAGLRPTTAAPPAPDVDRPEASRPFDPPPDPFL
jgi:hypothetical protein